MRDDSLGVRWVFSLSICCIALTLALVASAHEWYPPNCCSGQDCRPVPCSDIETKPDGSAIYKPEGTRFNQVQISQDAQCHVCSRTKRNIYNGHTESYGYCAFMPGTS